MDKKFIARAVLHMHLEFLKIVSNDNVHAVAIGKILDHIRYCLIEGTFDDIEGLNNAVGDFVHSLHKKEV